MITHEFFINNELFDKYLMIQDSSIKEKIYKSTIYCNQNTFIKIANDIDIFLSTQSYKGHNIIINNTLSENEYFLK